jgi:hypothetical protein
MTCLSHHVTRSSHLSPNRAEDDGTYLDLAPEPVAEEMSYLTMEPGEEEAGAGASPRLCDESNYTSPSNLIFRKDALPQTSSAVHTSVHMRWGDGRGKKLSLIK